MDSIVIVFAHPDDLACSMGGTALQLKEHFSLHLICATRGDHGVPAWSLPETATVRTKEEEAEARALDADLSFLNKVDAELFADEGTCRKVADILARVNPLAVMTLWPIDVHMDHSAISEITRKGMTLSGSEAELIYCEVRDVQTKIFSPNIYVDITETIDRKVDLIRCHKCQNRDDYLAQAFKEFARQRGLESGFTCAESFRTFTPSGRKSVLESLRTRRIPG